MGRKKKEEKKELVLEHWGVVYTDNNPYLAPEQVKASLVGEVYNHPNFEDGTYVVTSSVVHIDREKETVTTRTGSVYKLGKPAPSYEEIFPGARARFFSGQISKEV